MSQIVVLAKVLLRSLILVTAGLSVSLLLCSRSEAAPGDRDPTFPETIIDGDVEAFAVSSDGTAYIGGRIKSFRNIPVQAIGGITGYVIVKLLPSGEIDPGFSIGQGFKFFNGNGGIVSTLAVDKAGRLYVGGLFDAYDREQHNGLLRLLPDGKADPTFTPRFEGNDGGPLSDLVLSGKYLYIRGDLERVDGVKRQGFARLFLEDGRLDATFVPPPPDNIWPIVQFAPQSNGEILVVRNNTGPQRLLKTGERDATYTVNQADTGPISEFTARPDGRHLAYTSAGNVVGLLENGKLDPTFHSDAVVKLGGAFYLRPQILALLQNDFMVLAGRILLAPDGTTVTAFSLSPPLPQDAAIAFAATDRRRLWMVWRDFEVSGLRLDVHQLFEDSGTDAIEFVYDHYQADEAFGNVDVTLRRSGRFDGPATVSYRLTPESALEGVHYTGVEGTVTFDPGDVVAEFSVPLLDDVIPGTELTFAISLTSETATLAARTTTRGVIVDDDRAGTISFVTPGGTDGTDLSSGEGRTEAVSLTRTGGGIGKISVGFEITPKSADAADFLTSGGTVTFAEGESEVRLPLLVKDDNIVEELESAGLRLTSVSAGRLGAIPSVEIFVADNDAPGTGRTEFFKTANGVSEMVELPDGRIVAGGGGSVQFSVTHPDGTKDATYRNLPIGGNVLGVDVDGAGRILACGEFTRWSSIQLNYVARIMADGKADPDFMPATAPGPNARVYRIVPLADGRMIISGDFSKFGNDAANGIAKIFADGSLDPSFNCTSLLGADGASPRVEELELLADGKIFVGSEAFNVSGLPNRQLIRLNPDGSVDPSFVVATDVFNSEIEAILPMPEGSVIAGGDFFKPRGAKGNYILKLLADGSVDSNFSGAGTGPDNSVRELRHLPNGRILAVGLFSRWNDKPSARGAIIERDGTLQRALRGISLERAHAAVVQNRLAYFGGFDSGASIIRISILPPADALYQNATVWSAYWFSADTALDAEFWSRDEDGDLRTNFEEYTALTNPKVADLPREPTVEKMEDNALRLEFPRNWAAKDVDFTLEESGDGMIWSPVDPGNYELTNRDTNTEIVLRPISPFPRLQIFRGNSKLK